jgi:hypothetical protein
MRGGLARAVAAAAVAAAAAAVQWPSVARAAPGGPWASAPNDVTFAGALELFDAVSFDTGWQPAASPVQVRFSINLGSGFTCTMDGTSDLGWPAPLDLSFTPIAGTGELVMDVGMEVHSLYRFVLAVGAGTWTWEGEIPYLPNFDYRFADTEGFDPFLLPGAAPAGVTASDTIPDELLYMYDITDAIVPIPGIGGGVALYAGGQLDATLAGVDIDVAPEVVTTEGEHVLPAVPGEDPALVRDAVWEGTLTLAGTLTLTPTIYVELLGSTWDVASFPIPLAFPPAPIPWALDPASLDFPLPEIDVDAQNLAFAEVAQGNTVVEGVPVYDNGDLDLVVTVGVSGPGLTAAAAGPFVVPAHTVGSAAVVFAPLQAGPVMGVLTIESNDPDEPVVTLPIYASGGPDPDSDAGPDFDAGSDGGAAAGADARAGEDGAQPGGCGCRCAVAVRPGSPAGADQGRGPGARARAREASGAPLAPLALLFAAAVLWRRLRAR